MTTITTTTLPTVGQLLPVLSQHSVTVAPDTSVAHATALLANQTQGALLVLEQGRLVGLLDAQHLLGGRASQPVREVMLRELRIAAPEEPVAVCLQDIRAPQQYLPVVTDDRPLGLVALRDMALALSRALDAQVFLAQQLENYIVGRRS